MHFPCIHICFTGKPSCVRWGRGISEAAVRKSQVGVSCQCPVSLLLRHVLELRFRRLIQPSYRGIILLPDINLWWLVPNILCHG